MRGVSVAELSRRFPNLYHMAWEGSWESLQRHGLLSTSALLDLFGINGHERVRLELRHRPESVEISHPVHGKAMVRDQKPMSDDGLRRALRDGITPEEWYGLLNERVFFWLTRDRLLTMLGARAYRNLRQTVLTIDTASLLGAHEHRVTLSPINSGATKPMPHPRGRNTFLPLATYPWDDWISRRGKAGDTAVELAVTGAVPDLARHVIKVEEYHMQSPVRVIWERD